MLRKAAGLTKHLRRWIGSQKVAQKLTVPRQKFIFGVDSPELIVRPRPPAIAVDGPDALYIENVRKKVESINDASNVAAIVASCISDKQLRAVQIVIRKCVEKDIKLETEMCIDLFGRFASHYMFNPACTIATQLVRSDAEALDPALVAMAISGSMAVGSHREALLLLNAIVNARRSDLLEAIGSVKVTLPDDNNKEKEAIVLSGADCNLGIDVLLSALREGWFSATSYRILISMMLARRRDKGNPIETLLKTSIAYANELKMDTMPLLQTFIDVPPPAKQRSTPAERAEFGRIISIVLGKIVSIIENRVACPPESDLDSDLPFLTSPMKCEAFIKMYWKASSLSQRYDVQSQCLSDELLVNELTHMHASLKEFSESDSLSASFSIPWGYQRRSFRILVDLLGLEHKIRSKEIAIDLINVSVFKYGGSNGRNTAVQFASIESIVDLNRRKEDTSPLKLLCLPPGWVSFSKLLAETMNPDGFMMVFGSVLFTMKGRHSNSVWALSMLDSFISKKEPSTIPAYVVEGILHMCMYKTDIYGMFEVLSLVRERGIPLSESTWSKVLVVSWAGGSGHLTSIGRSRVMAQAIELIKHCSGTLDGPAVAVLMRYLYFKNEENDSFLYKIIDRLYKDKTQEITAQECTVLCACLYRRNKFLGANKNFELSRPLFTTSRFIIASELGEIRLYDELSKLVQFLPQGFFKRFDTAWVKARTKDGRAELYSLTNDLLFHEQLSFLVTVPVHHELRNAVCTLSVYVAFLIGHNDRQFRLSYDLLHRVSTLYKQFEDNQKDKRLYEYSCPRRYNCLEPFSHFNFGWIENGPLLKSSKSVEDSAAMNNANVDRLEQTKESGVSLRNNLSDGTEINVSENGQRPAVLTAQELRLRADRNVRKETIRGIDVKKPNQRMKSSSAFLPLERLRFIPERS